MLCCWEYWGLLPVLRWTLLVRIECCCCWWSCSMTCQSIWHVAALCKKTDSGVVAGDSRRPCITRGSRPPYSARGRVEKYWPFYHIQIWVFLFIRIRQTAPRWMRPSLVTLASRSAFLVASVLMNYDECHYVSTVQRSLYAGGHCFWAGAMCVRAKSLKVVRCSHDSFS